VQEVPIYQEVPVYHDIPAYQGAPVANEGYYAPNYFEHAPQGPENYAKNQYYNDGNQHL